MSTTNANKNSDSMSKLPSCDDCGYSPTRASESLSERLSAAGYDRPYVEVEFGLSGESRALLCPVCGNVVRRTE